MSSAAITVSASTPQPAVPAKGEVKDCFERLQDRICQALEQIDRTARFHEDRWSYPGGGGGRSRVLQGGAVFEKAGVNCCAIQGVLPEAMAAKMKISAAPFFATGISLVLHPDSPMIPIVHMNLRYFEQTDGNRWFGGGADLTPCYPFLQDVRHFHKSLQTACDKHDVSYYPRFKKWCDEYFFIRHRNETRGVGGIFFDHLRTDPSADFAFVQEVGDAFLSAYLPIVESKRAMPFGEREKNFQLIRRARYVEFNLVYDRGTAFGLETQGRVESILMSLPPQACWPYGWSPEPGSREAELARFLVPQDWVGSEDLARRAV
jgi:coproporphyrinogen III oxidase